MLLKAMAIIAVFTLQSCASRFYQVYDVETENLKCDNKKILFENNECEITYHLWGRSGNLGFIFKNKTDKDIYIDLTRSFFIRNGFAYDYYSDKEYTKSTTGSIGASATIAASYQQEGYMLPLWIPTSVTRGGAITGETALSHSKSVTSKEAKQICIPAKSAKNIIGFNISDYVYFDCDDKAFNKPHKNSRTLTYTQKDTPLSFRNRIVYTFTNDITGTKTVEETTIDHSFWVKSLTNYKEGDFIINGTKVDCINKFKTIPTQSFKYKAANRFYNKYEINK